MADTYEIKEYKYYTFSSRDGSGPNSVLLLYGDGGGYRGGVFFYNNDAPLQQAVKYSSGVIGLFYRYADLPVLIDMLRNEKPVYLIFDGGANSRISTSTEPIGEGERL